MKYAAAICWAVLMLAWGSTAQVSQMTAQAEGPAPNLLATNFGVPAAFAPAMAAVAAPDPAAALPAQQGQGVFAVFPEYQTELYVGYTYFRFYEIPHFAENMNGLNLSLAYYVRDWIAADGEFVATFGTQSGQDSKFVMGMGGVRFRVAEPRGLKVWVHGLAGGSHFLPQTPFGNQEAFGYEVGGGVDFVPPHKRFGLRVQGDMIGTHYFGTFQYGPKISAGVLYRF